MIEQVRSPREIAEQLLDLAGELYANAGNDDSQVPKIAALFCAMSDDGQAQFFEHVAHLMRGWPRPAASDFQRHQIAGHMKTCECVTEAGREWVIGLAGYLAEPAS